MNPSPIGMNKIKIAHITTIDISMRYLLLNQLRSIQQAGYEVIGVSSPGPEVSAIKAAGIRHIPVRMSRKPFTPLQDLKALWQLYRVIRRERFTIVHTHTPKAGIFGRLAAKAASVPIIIHTHHGFPAQENSIIGHLFRILEKITARFSNLILSVNHEDIEVGIRNGTWPASKVKLCGEGGIGIDINRFNPERIVVQELIIKKRAEVGLTDRVKVVGFAGRLVRDKGLLELLEAARVVYLQIPEVRFLIIGSTDSEKHDSLTPGVAQRYDVSNICYFLGMRQDMPELYALMDVFVLPSHREGFGLVLAEAAAMGVPVIATNIRGCREAVEHGHNGVLVPLGDVNALANAIIELLTDREKARRMGKEGRRMAIERFDERLVFEKVKAEYARLLSEKGLPVPQPPTTPAEVLS